ncbi:MAG: hypothetical protein ACOX8X_02895 [Methanomethylophilus sp.]|jgi:hypothetical protein
MGIFSKNETVLELDGAVIGEVNLHSDTGTGYDNVRHFAFDVSANRQIRAHVVADKPVDAVLAYEDGSVAGHKDGVTDAVLGPFSTKKYASMALFLGVVPGDRAKVSVRVWTDKK